MRISIQSVIWILLFSVLTVNADVLKIVHLSDPVLPDETVLVMGGVFSKNVSVEVRKSGNKRWMPAKILQGNKNSFQFVLPASRKFGIYEVRAKDGGKYSGIEKLNIPRVRWVQGNLGLDATPGGYVRVFGLSMNFKGYHDSIKNAPASKVRLKNMSSGKETVFPAEVISNFSLKVKLPANLAEGKYLVSVNNGYDQEFYGNPEELLTVKKLNWPDTVFNAKKLGGVEKALEAAKANKGGIVLLPAGIYSIKHLYPWEVPDNTILRGEGPEKTFVIFDGLYEDVDNALITGKRFALENMGIRVFKNFEKVVEVRKTDAFWAKNLNIIAVTLGRTLNLRRGDIIYRNKRVWADQNKRPYVFHFIGGSNIVMSDCDFVAPRCRNMIGNSNGFISNNNKVHTQYIPCGLWTLSHNGGLNHRILHENSNFTLQNSANKFYMQNCEFFGYLVDGDGDAMSTDCCDVAYTDRIASVDGKKVTLAADFRKRLWYKNFSKWPALIISGRGAGQLRIATRTGKNQVTLNEPFDIKPDKTSFFVIQSPCMDHYYIANDLKDGGRIQIYGAGARMVIHGNLMKRMGGVNIWPGGGHPAGSCNIFDQVTANKLLGPIPRRIYHPYRAGFRIRGDHRKAKNPWRQALAQGTIFRRNYFYKASGVLVRGKCFNSIIEKNKYADSPLGIEVSCGTISRVPDKTLIPEQTLLRDNKFKNVTKPYSGNCIKDTLIIPKPGK